MLLAAALLLATATAPVVGPEIASTPIPIYAFPPPGPAAPLAVDGNSFLLAFTTNDGGRARTVVTRLDAQAHAIAGASREIPVTDPAHDAVLPSVAVAPNGYFVAQTEIALPGAFVVVWHLDRNLNPDPAPFAILNKSMSGVAPTSGLVRVDGNRVFVISDDLIAEHELGGARVRLMRGPFAVADAYVAGGTLATAGVDTAPLTRQCFFTCFSVPQHFDALVSFDTVEPIRMSFDFYSPNGIAAAGDDTTMLYVLVGPNWMEFLRYDRLGRHQIDFTPQPFGPILLNDSPQRPSVATDGTRFVAVWRIAGQSDQHAIGAAAIDRDGTVTPIAIPNLADETRPFVLAAGPNRFLVSYLSRHDGEYRIAGRFITFVGRRPVVGR
jgi:hypothetical protein